MSISRRTVTIDSEKIAYTYNTRNRQVIVKAKSIEFTATCWDSAAAEIRDHLTPQPANTEAVAATTPAVVLALPNVFATANLHHELVTLADGTHAPKCRKRPTQGTATHMANPFISCNSCSGAHLPGTHLG